MAFARKRAVILALNPDLMVIQECSARDASFPDSTFSHWVGTNPHKGLAVIARSSRGFEIDTTYSADLPWFLPVKSAELGLNILAVWAHVKTSTLRYVRLSHEALHHYDAFLTSPAVAIGDFNSNAIWDRQHGGRSHSNLVAKLGRRGLESVYHGACGEPHGSESQSTQFMYRHLTRGYHLDYAFASSDLLAEAVLEIGHPAKWLEYSDHMPLILDLQLPRRAPL